MDKVLDLIWLRAEVRESYAVDGSGRPGIDPEVALRLMLAGLLVGIVHERRWMREAEVNNAIRLLPGSAPRRQVAFPMDLPQHARRSRRVSPLVELPTQRKVEHVAGRREVPINAGIGQLAIVQAPTQCGYVVLRLNALLVRLDFGQIFIPKVTVAELHLTFASLVEQLRSTLGSAVVEAALATPPGTPLGSDPAPAAVMPAWASELEGDDPEDEDVLFASGKL